MNVQMGLKKAAQFVVIGVTLVGDSVFALELPFKAGETWYVCQGYNGSISHSNTLKYSLDLSISSNSITGGTGCSAATASSSSGKEIYAPGSGKVAWWGSTDKDIVCINLDSGGSVKLGHMERVINTGDTVISGKTLIGKLSAPKTTQGYNNGGYSHIHMGYYINSGCSGEQPFGTLFGSQSPNLSSNGSKNQWYGTVLTKPTILLKALSIFCPSSVNENSSNAGVCNSTAYFTDNSNKFVTPSWSSNNNALSVSTNGMLSTVNVSADANAIVTGSYSENGKMVQGTAAVKILNALSTPVVTTKMNNNTATVTWAAVLGATTYRIVVSQYADFRDLKDNASNSSCGATCYTTTTSNTNYNHTGTLANWTYYVKVRAGSDKAPASPWSTVVSFKTPAK